MILENLKKIKLPDAPGVYFFKKNNEILYIGKATSLKDRVKSYFSNDLIKTRGSAILDMVTQSNSIDFEETSSVLEALMLESELIKKHQPKYNVKEKDDKSYYKIIITDEEYPRILLVRNRELKEGNFKFKIKKDFGPFPNAGQLRTALKLVQKIFPFFDYYKPINSLSEKDKKRIKLNMEIGLYPNIFFDSKTRITKQEYYRIIKNVSLFFSGKKKNLIKELKKRMMTLAKSQKFEEADNIKKTIFAIEHINDIAIIKQESSDSDRFFETPLQEDLNFRIESYDIAHMSGNQTVGVMTVANEVDFIKSEYKKFVIKQAKKGDDYGALLEILTRRFAHPEWTKPNLIVIDGGIGQRNTCLDFLLKSNIKNIQVVSVVKDDRHKAREILGLTSENNKYRKMILRINEETHRFAIAFHRKRRSVLK